MKDKMRTIEDTEDSMADLIEGLRRQFNRLPTEDEVNRFIFGTKEERMDIWNKGKSDGSV